MVPFLQKRGEILDPHGHCRRRPRGCWTSTGLLSWKTAYTFEYAVPTEAEFAARFERIHRFFPWLVWEENGRVTGYAYADRAFERAAYQWCADLSIYLSPDAQGKGVGRRLYGILEDFLRLQGYCVAYGNRHLGQPRKLRLPRGAGLPGGRPVRPLRLEIRRVVRHGLV